jgi:hypothetical protein
MPRRSSACSLTIERLQLRDGLFRVAHDAALSELEIEVGGIEAGFLDHLGDAANEILLLELPAREVDRETQADKALLLPGSDLRASGAQNPATEVENQPGLLS